MWLWQVVVVGTDRLFLFSWEHIFKNFPYSTHARTHALSTQAPTSPYSSALPLSRSWKRKEVASWGAADSPQSQEVLRKFRTVQPPLWKLASLMHAAHTGSWHVAANRDSAEQFPGKVWWVRFGPLSLRVWKEYISSDGEGKCAAEVLWIISMALCAVMSSFHGLRYTLSPRLLQFESWSWYAHHFGPYFIGYNYRLIYFPITFLYRLITILKKPTQIIIAKMYTLCYHLRNTLILNMKL